MFSWERDPRKRHLLFIEGEGESGGGTITEEGQHEEVQQSEGQHSQSVPYDRFSQVNREKQDLAKQLEAYKKFGSIEDLAATIARSKELSSGTRFTATELKALEEDLKQVPALREAFDFIAQQKAATQEHSSQFANDAASKVSSLVKELGFDLKNDADRRSFEFDVQAAMADRIKRTPGWLGRWNRGDMSVVTDAWKVVRPFYSRNRVAQNASIQATKLNQGTKPGPNGAAPNNGQKDDGTPRTDDGRIDERAVLSKAADRGFARLMAAKED